MSWKSIADLIDRRCGRAGRAARRADGGGLGDARPLRPRAGDGPPRAARFSTYDLVETGASSSFAIRDAGDVPVQGVMPADGFAPIRDAVAALHRATMTSPS